MGVNFVKIALLLMAALAIGCSQKSLPENAAYNEAVLGNLANLIAENQMKGADPQVIRELEARLNAKRTASALSRTNQTILAEGMKENTKFHSLKGKYKILVIPVQFSDVQIERPDFYTNVSDANSAYQKLFGNGPNTLRTFYRHQSLGAFDVDGVMTSIVSVKGKLEEYGEAIVGENDKNAQLLVKQALQGVMSVQTNPDWWQQFDQWDLHDYDGDGNYYEPDGFIDAVVLVYAGKPQSSCQRVFDPKGERPASKDYPEGPRQKAAVECFNRLWPHRSALQLAKDDTDYSEKGPKIEGYQRPSLNGLKINDEIFALDYNMQAEYSDVATFIHEFGHSLTLPDVYATKSAENSTGAWEVMSSTSTANAQELSSWSRLVLGWLSPKIVTPNQHITSLYLGTMNYLDAERRNDYVHSNGPDHVTEVIDGQEHVYDVLSVVPGSDEPVYRSAVVSMPSTQEDKKIIEYKPENGKYAVYTSHYDGESRAMKVKLDVPSEGLAELSFDTIWEIETGTNFESTEEPIKINVHYDVATVSIEGKEVDRLELLSGDADHDSLVEANADCEVDKVKDLRKKVFGKTASDDEKKEFAKKLALCRKASWVKKKYDLSAHKGKTVSLEIRYTTDPGYTDMGVIIDNIQLGSTKIDFENESQHKLAGGFEILKEGIQNLQHNQYYIMEYRDPETEFTSTAAGQAINYDRNIRVGVQGMFLDDGKNSIDKFRMLEARYQPGVLVWYYNSKFDLRNNNPLINDGKGYLLVLNANRKELLMPGPWAKPDLFDADGFYKDPDKDPTVKATVEKQRMEYVCFSHTDFYKYLEGIEAACENYKDSVNYLKRLKMGTQSLIFSREFINEIHPMDYDSFYFVNRPFTHTAGVLTALSTFRPPEAEAYSAFSAFKIDSNAQTLVKDEEFSKAITKYAPVSGFSDLKYDFPKNKDRWGDTVNVEKKGFSFEVVQPSKHIVSRYANRENSQSHDFFERRPRAKIYFLMEPTSTGQ